MAKFSKADAKDIRVAREDRISNPGYYARTVSSIQRCGSLATQKLVEAVIAEDGTDYLFRRVNGCLVEARL